MKRVFPIFVLASLPAVAGAQLRVVTWNTLDKPTSSNDADLRTVFSAIATESVNGIARPVDVLALQEQTTTSPTQLAALLNGLHGVSSYVASVPTGQGNNDRLGFVYNSATVQLLQSSLVASGGTRPFARARFRPVGYSSTDAAFYVYSLHLNAGNAATRATETATLRSNANALGNVGILFSGDYNIDASTEQAMLNLTSAGGSAQAFDPVNRPGTWSNNSAFASIHTQSTRTTDLGDGGATGGVDDRFDQHLASASMMSGEGISYLGPTAAGTVGTHSYRAFGNNGSVFNKAINDPANTSKPRSVLDALQRASDHLPVVLDLQLPARMSVTVAPHPAEVIQDANVSVAVAVSNAAPVSTTLAGDELDYTITGEGALSGSQSGSIRPLVTPALATLRLDTRFVGLRGGTISVGSSSRAAEDADFTQDISYRVRQPSGPSLSPSGPLLNTIVDIKPWEDHPRDGLETVTLYNLARPGLGVAMDIDRILAEGDADVLRLEVPPVASLLPGESLTLTPRIDPAAVGTFTTRYWIEVSDENLPGERRHALEILLRATVPEPTLPLAPLSGLVLLARRRRR